MKTLQTLFEESIEGLNTSLTFKTFIDLIRENQEEGAYYLNLSTLMYEYLLNEDAFSINIIYYHKAMEYLKENDPSLQESLELAKDLGYELQNINSEILASLHASDMSADRFLSQHILFARMEEEIEELIENNKL